MSYVPWYKRMEPITLGERFELDQFSTARKTLSPTKSYAEKPTYNWEEGNWWDLEDESVGGTKILEDFEITDEMRRRPNAEGGRIGYKEAGPVKPVLYKIIQRGHPEEGRWAYKRSDNPIMYFDTKKEAEWAKKVSKILQYEGMERPTSGAFQKRVKNLLDEGLTKKQVAKELKVNFKVVDRAIKEGNIKWKFEPYINVPKNLKYVKKNYGILSRETMAKKLFPNEPLSTSLSRIGKLSQKLFDTGELKPIEGPTKEHAKKHGYYKDPEHVINKRIKEQRLKLIDTTSDLSNELKLLKLKKGSNLDMSHRLSLKQSSYLNSLYNLSNLGIDDPTLNREKLKPFENKLEKIYKQQNEIYKTWKGKKLPSNISKEIESLNKAISEIVASSKGRIQGIHLDEFTLQPKVTGVEASKTIGAGVVDKPIKNLTKADLDLIKLNLPEQLKAEKLSKVSPVLKSEVIPGASKVEGLPRYLQSIGQTYKATGLVPTLFSKVLPPVGVGLGAYFSQKAYKEGRPIDEVVTEFFGAGKVPYKIKEYFSMSDKGKAAEHRRAFQNMAEKAMTDPRAQFSDRTYQPNFTLEGDKETLTEEQLKFFELMEKYKEKKRKERAGILQLWTPQKFEPNA